MYQLTYQAIVTKYHGPTNTRGSRIIARADAGFVTLEYDPAQSIDTNHLNAAIKLCNKFKWNHTKLIVGYMPNGGRVFVFSHG